MNKSSTVIQGVARDFIKVPQGFNVPDDQIFLGDKSVNPLTKKRVIYSKTPAILTPNKSSDSPYLFSKPAPANSVADAYARAYFKELDNRDYIESILERTGLGTTTPPILSNIKTKPMSQFPMLHNTVSIIPDAPMQKFGNSESAFTKSIKRQRGLLQENYKQLTQMEISPVTTPKSPNAQRLPTPSQSPAVAVVKRRPGRPRKNTVPN